MSTITTATTHTEPQVEAFEPLYVEDLRKEFEELRAGIEEGHLDDMDVAEPYEYIIYALLAIIDHHGITEG